MTSQAAMSRRLSSCPRRCSATARAWRPSCRLWMPLTELLRACRCREPGTGPVPAARLVAGQRRAGERGDERGRRCGAGEQGPLTAGSGPPLVEPAQQRGDRLGVAVVAERGIDMIQEAGAERRRTGGLPGDRVGSCPGEPLPRRGGQRRGDLPGRRGCRRLLHIGPYVLAGEQLLGREDIGTAPHGVVMRCSRSRRWPRIKAFSADDGRAGLRAVSRGNRKSEPCRRNGGPGRR